MSHTTHVSVAILCIVVIAIVAVVIQSQLSFVYPAASSPYPPQKTQTILYSCGEGKHITATMYENTLSLALDDGRTMTLVKTVSADGVRFANTDESFVFWSKGEGALVLENDVEKSYRNCSVVANE